MQNGICLGSLGFKVCLFMLLFSFVLFFPGMIYAEGQYADDWQYLIKRDYVNDLAVYEGSIWQGINGGLVVRSLYGPDASRFYHRLNSGLDAVQVLSVAVEGNGSVWAGTNNGAFRRSDNGEWITYNRDNSPLTVNTVRVVTPDKQGGIWLGTWLGGVYYLDRENVWTAYNTQNSGIPGNRINAIVPDEAGGVWFGTDSRGVAYLDSKGGWTVYNTANSFLPTNDVQDILIDKAGRVWFATMSGLTCFDQKGRLETTNEEGRWKVFNLENSQIPSEIVNSLVLDNEGKLWLGTNGGLACLVDVSGEGTWRVYTTANSLIPASVVRSVGIDMGGTVWAGTWGGGLAGLNPKNNSWRVYNQDTVSLKGGSLLPSNTASKILPFPEGIDEGKVWFATDAGVAFYEGNSGNWGLMDRKNNLPVNRVNSFARDALGNMAFATEGGGLAVKSAAGAWRYYDKENSQIFSDNLADVAYDLIGGIWLVTLGGEAAHLSSGGNWTVYLSEDNWENNALPDGAYRLNSVYCDAAGNIWFGTWGGGAVRLSNAGNWTAFKAGRTGMPSNDVSSIVADGAGNVWFGTWGGGAARLDGAGRWDIFNTENSNLRSDIIRDLVVDSRGWIWIATPQGAAYYDGTEWHLLRSRDSGLPVNSIWGLATDTLGNVWFSTNENGVAVYNPDGLGASLARLTDITEKEREAIIIYNGRYLPSDVPPLMREARLLMPMRPVATALGAGLDWDGDSGKVEMTLGEKTVELFIDDNRAYIDGELNMLDVPARLHMGRTLVPVRFISEGLGISVTWDPIVRAVFLK